MTRKTVSSDEGIWWDISSVPMGGSFPKYPDYCDCERKKPEDAHKSCGCGFGQCEKGLIL